MAQQDIDAFLKAFTDRVHEIPDIKDVLEQDNELLRRVTTSLRNVVEHVPSEHRNATLGKQLGNIFVETFKSEVLSGAENGELTAKLDAFFPAVEKKYAVHVLENIPLKDAGKLEKLSGIAGVEGDALKALTDKAAKGFFHNVVQFFKHEDGHLNKTRVSVASIVGIGVAGGTLYLLTRQNQTPQEKKAWADRVAAHGEQQQGAAVQR